MIHIAQVTQCDGCLRRVAVLICRRANDLPAQTRASLQVWIVGDRIVGGLTSTAEARQSNPEVVIGSYGAGVTARDIFDDLRFHLSRTA